MNLLLTQLAKWTAWAGNSKDKEGSTQFPKYLKRSPKGKNLTIDFLNFNKDNIWYVILLLHMHFKFIINTAIRNGYILMYEHMPLGTVNIYQVNVGSEISTKHS